jgi:hypothetical protein
VLVIRSGMLRRRLADLRKVFAEAARRIGAPPVGPSA